MIIHKLILECLHPENHQRMLDLEADDAIRWMWQNGVSFRGAMRVLDMACGNGTFGGRLKPLGCDVTFADHNDALLPELAGSRFWKHDFNTGIVGAGWDLIICSNFLEHLHAREAFFSSLPAVLTPGGYCYLSWTPWLSPYGGHEYAPWHYLGMKAADKLHRGERWFKLADINGPAMVGNTLYKSYVGQTIRRLRRLPGMQIVAMAPRYFTEFPWIMRIPLLREFLCWNASILLRRE